MNDNDDGKKTGKVDNVEAPVNAIDGSPVDPEELARVHSGLKTGELKIEMAPGVEEEMRAAGLDIDTIKEALIKGTAKGLN